MSDSDTEQAHWINTVTDEKSQLLEGRSYCRIMSYIIFCKINLTEPIVESNQKFRSFTQQQNKCAMMCLCLNCVENRKQLCHY